MNSRIAQNAWLRITRLCERISVSDYFVMHEKRAPRQERAFNKTQVSVQNFQRAPNSTESTSW